MATLLDISRKTGLALTTISGALNNRPGYSHATRKRVQQAAEALGYTANPLARGLLGKSTKTMGLLWSLGGPHSAEAMSRTMTMRMQKHGYQTHLADCLNDPEVTLKLLADFSRRGVDGVVLQEGEQVLQIPSILRQLEKFNAVLIVGDFPPKEIVHVDYLHHDRLPAYVEAANHFAGIGRRRPAIMGIFPNTQPKADVFLSQAGRRGMKVSDDAVIDVEVVADRSLTESGQVALEQRFNGREVPFDALMCTTDELAIVAVDYLRRRGLRVPDDVAVAGFNNSMVGPYQLPPLASGDRRDDEVAEAVEQMIFSRLEDSDAPPRRKYIAARFVWRESAGGTGIAN